ncbi:MAG: SpoIIE family protein phosphatase [Armatimonadota bacterium]
MAERYVHVEIEASQLSRKTGQPCGDVVSFERSSAATTIVVCDGIGHGIKANVAANLCVSRILELLRQGYSLRKTFNSLVTTMEEAKGTDLPYAVFTLVRILNDGVTSVLTYEMPGPIFVTSRYAQVLAQRTLTVGNCLVHEANCHTAPGEGVLVVTDGVTQAGLGRGLASGWTIEGVGQYVSDCLSAGAALKTISRCVLTQARDIWGETLGDDCTAALARCRHGKTVTILTGPPGEQSKDHETVQRFMRMEGIKVVCGGTTAQIVAKALGKELAVEQNPQSLLAPPRYTIDGVDFVTEGAVTLNQVYNVMDEDPESFDEESGVTELHSLLRSADRVNLLIGSAVNPATRHVSFRQKGVLTRQMILPLITEKLRQAGKLVVVENV